MNKRRCSKIKVILASATMGKTPLYVKLRITSLSSKSKSINAIVHQLQNEGIKIRRQTVARILKQFKENGTLADKTATGRRPTLTTEHMNLIDAKMEENDELTAIGKNSLLAVTEIIVLFYSVLVKHGL